MTAERTAAGIPATLVVADQEGGSSFVDIVLRGQRSDYGLDSLPFPATGVVLRNTRGGPTTVDFHPAPRRQMVITARGRVAYGCTSGEIREVGAGDVVIFDDTTGTGHSARVIEGPRLQVFVPLDETVDLATMIAHADDHP